VEFIGIDWIAGCLWFAIAVMSCEWQVVPPSCL